MQGIGILLGGLAYVIVLLAFKDQIESDYTYLDYVWRIVIGLGIVPAIAAIYFRLTIPETPRYTVDVNGDTEKATRDVQKVMAMNSVANVTSGFKEEDVAVGRVEVKQNTFSDFCNHFGKWENFKVLFGVAYCWFALDVACKTF
jgi:MFS transporter, PHS family, inorganic phosphate transporter